MYAPKITLRWDLKNSFEPTIEVAIRGGMNRLFMHDLRKHESFESERLFLQNQVRKRTKYIHNETTYAPSNKGRYRWSTILGTCKGRNIAQIITVAERTPLQSSICSYSIRCKAPKHRANAKNESHILEREFDFLLFPKIRIILVCPCIMLKRDIIRMWRRNSQR